MARHFVRLKLALLGSAFRRGWRHGFGLLAGVAVGLPLAAVVAAGVALSAFTDAGDAVLVLVFALLAVGWTVAPILAFGLDETLDPTRLRLLPLSRRQLVTGLSAAAAIGVVPVATLLVLAAGLAHARGPGNVAVAVVAVAAQALVCLWAGRALTTALSATLRSRKGRDLAAAAAMLLALLLAGAGQVPNLLLNFVGQGPGAGERLVALLDRVADVVVLTPPGWAAGAIVAAGAGRWATALGLVGATVALAAALAWAWQAALDRTLSKPDTASASAGEDDPLFPVLLRLAPRGHLSATIAKELRYLLRVPQLRVGFALLVVMGVAIVVATFVVEPLSRPEIVYAAAVLGALQALQGINAFGHDRGAVWLLVAGGRGYRMDLAGKGLAHAGSTLLVIVPLMGVLAAVTGGWNHLLPALAVAVTLQLTVHGVGAVSSVLAPHPLPEGAANLWGGASGMGCATVVLQLVAFSAQGLLLLPAIGAVGAAVLLAPPMLPVVAVLAVAYGAGIWWGGVTLAAARLDARGPEFVGALSADVDR